jgi:outer membrane biosynthesis protein TonB
MLLEANGGKTEPALDRADQKGVGLAIVGHLALLAALAIGISRRVPPIHAAPQTMDVQLVDAVGLQSAAPAPATEAPQEQTAPEAGPPEEAPPPEPAPAPTPVPKAVKEPVPAPPAPKPVPTPAPAEKPKKVEPPKPAARLSSNFLKDISSAAKSEAKGASEGKGSRTTGSKLGPDFLKGIAAPSAGKGTTARASITGPAMNGLAAAIKRQVQPCYDLGALGGTPAMQIVTVLQIRFNKDGSVQSAQVTEQTGVDGSNARYKQQMAEVSRAAVLRCSPLKLPVELYAGGWENIEMGFIPRQMQ